MAVKKCVIFCAGAFFGLQQPIGAEDFVIAADGGYVHTTKLGLTPDAVLGDFDSLGYTPEGAAVYPVEKDDTDAMLAVRLGLRKGCREFLIYGGLEGPRLDHTIANLQTLQFLADRDARGVLVGKSQSATVLKNGSLSFPAGCRGHISLFCMGAPARGVSISGLGYLLEDGQLDAGFPLGVSNHFTEAEATVTVRDGSLLILWDNQDVII